MTTAVGDLVVLAAVVAGIALVAWLLRRREGTVRAAAGPALSEADLDALGAPRGRILLVEFTAPGCVPCRAALVVLSEVARDREDVAVLTAEVGEHLGIARAHGVLRAPTTLVVSADGAVHHRIAGVPAPEVVAALLDEPAGSAAASPAA